MPEETKKPLLLLVEDSEDDAFFFTRALKKCGALCSLHHATNGAEAVEFLGSNRGTDSHSLPCIIFLDLKMPVLNGFEVLSWIRTQNFPAEIPVVVLSGSDQEHDKSRATQLGASGYLVKPVTAKDLQRHLQEICPPVSETAAHL